MRIYADLSWPLDADDWARRHAAGLLPDATPYGLHRLVREGDALRFATPVRTGVFTPVISRIKARARDYDLIETTATRLTDRSIPGADVLLAMDERTGVPAALLPGGPPVVCGLNWLERREDLPAWMFPLVCRALRRMAATFVECRPMLGPVVSEFGAPADRLHFVRLGIDADHFRPAPWPTAQVPTVFSVGDDRMRDHGALIEALAAVRASGTPVRFELATTLPVQMPPGLGVVHARRMDDAVRDCYARASVVALALHPTRQGSGLTVILEAMASGRPVVVTDNPGLSDYVVDGETGFLVPPGDPRALAEAVRALLADPAKAAAMGTAGRRRVEAEFTSSHFAADLRQVLDQAVSVGRPRR